MARSVERIRRYRTLLSVNSGYKYTRDTNTEGDTIVAISKGMGVHWALNVNPKQVPKIFKRLRARLQKEEAFYES
jgi:hypothetical protein